MPKKKEFIKFTENKGIWNTESACNDAMKCEDCGEIQRNRAVCFFCKSLQRNFACVQCKRTECPDLLFGSCVIRHFDGGLKDFEFVGAICDFCELWICHSKNCLDTHACDCPMKRAACVECKRDSWDLSCQMYKCGFCDLFLCEDDQLQHQAQCQVLDSPDYKCKSCNRHGHYSCLKCKVSYCDVHVRRKGVTYDIMSPFPCPKCSTNTFVTKDISVTAKSYKYGKGT